jgi:thiol-disulfide isomerase/thioredoxin
MMHALSATRTDVRICSSPALISPEVEQMLPKYFAPDSVVNREAPGRFTRGRGTFLAVLGLSLLLCSAGQGQQKAHASGDNAPPAAEGYPVLPIGAHAPDFSLPGIDGKTHSLREYSSAKVLAIIFTCNHCPVAQMYEKRIKQLVTDYRNRGVALVVIMGNDDKAEKYSEWGFTDVGDSFQDMKTRAAYRKLNYPYLYDGATQAVARKYGPTATPHIFIFDQQRILRYEGRIDSNPREELATKHEARDALNSLLASKEIAVTSTPAMGCSTKWAFKEDSVKAEAEKNNAKPVIVDLIAPAQLKTLVKNHGADKILFINFWATWCAPCMEEFPEIQKMVRMYDERQVDFVTVSVNSPDEKKLVLNFLQKQHAFNRNLLLNSNDAAEAVAAFGGTSDWKGAVPYTAIIGANGKILYSTQGGVMNPMDVRRALLKQLPDDRYLGQQAYWNSTF